MLTLALNRRLTFVASKSKLSNERPELQRRRPHALGRSTGLQAVAENCDGFNFRLCCKIICMNHLDSLEKFPLKRVVPNFSSSTRHQFIALRRL
jgi:hypothetical protein